jgi:DNA-binding PadR family transcriptional regulator
LSGITESVIVEREGIMDDALLDWGRFSEAAFLILLSLAGGAKHGYAMMEDIAAVADVRLRAGTLYGALTRLEERGLVEPLPTADRRRPYRLTSAGVAALQAQLTSLDARVAVGRQRLAADQAS